MAPNDVDRKPSPDGQRPEIPPQTRSFTAVNGVNTTNGITSPKSSDGQPKRDMTPSTPREGSSKMNGIVHHGPSPERSNSSPSLNESTGPGQADTPDSQRSPPIRKRSYPEAFGDSDRRDDSLSRQAREDQRPPAYSRIHPEDRDSSTERERDRQTPNDADPHAPMGHNYYPSRSQALGDTEQRLAAAALRQEGETSIARKELPPVLPNNEDPSRLQFAEYERGGSGVQVDRDGKRRKRIFSNRTKTGCMTCRKRKKKCDEQHPECEYLFLCSLPMARLLLHRWHELHCLCVM